MGKMMTTLVAFGLGAATYRMAQRTDMVNDKSMRRMRKRVTNMFS